jgi:transcriptional regulator with XRE-family HTH domain
MKTTSLLEIAKKIGVSHQAIYGWRNGKYLPSAKNLRKLVKLKDPMADKLLKAVLK